eukprot:snap_masked-scaffold_19-processed-gene-3.42-mRNA-1 protein AED:1.00 eAED:1.00 QI:0/0/0/0/1/1/2/0/562
MIKLYSLFLLDLFTIAVSEVFVTFTEIGQTIGPFPTTRFSELMGDFSATCEIEAQATLLFPTENPCDSSSFERNLTGLIIIPTFLQSFGCFEEEAYTNLEDLGAIAILNSEPRPAGLPMFRSHIGYKKNDSKIPFLDTNLEFFGGVFLRIAQTQENITLQINNCADDNPHETCYVYIELVFQAGLMVIIFWNVSLVVSSLRKITRNEGTKPRRFILNFFLWTLFLFAVIGFFNLSTVDGFVWISGGKYKSDISFFLAGLQTNLLFFGTLISAYYWAFLGNKCFLLSWKASNNILLKCFRFISGENFFKGAGISFIVAQIFLLRPESLVQEIFNIFFIFDAIIGFFFFTANSLFVGNIIQTIESKIRQSSFGNLTTPPKFSLLTKFTGYGLVAYIEANSLAADNASRRTLLMASHLSLWLQRYFILFFIVAFQQYFLVDRMVTFGEFDDSIRLRLCTFVGFARLLIGTRLLMTACLIKGIAGPSKRLSTLNKETGEENTEANNQTTQSGTRVLSTPFPQSENKGLTLTPEFLKPTPNVLKSPGYSSVISLSEIRTSKNPQYKL